MNSSFLANVFCVSVCVCVRVFFFVCFFPTLAPSSVKCYVCWLFVSLLATDVNHRWTWRQLLNGTCSQWVLNLVIGSAISILLELNLKFDTATYKTQDNNKISKFSFSPSFKSFTFRFSNKCMYIHMYIFWLFIFYGWFFLAYVCECVCEWVKPPNLSFAAFLFHTRHTKCSSHFGSMTSCCCPAATVTVATVAAATEAATISSWQCSELPASPHLRIQSMKFRLAQLYI